jgi:tripartite-type tricarboxylate transporter receptor subunit TctC
MVRWLGRLIVAACAVCVANIGANAQEYPNRPITIVVTQAAGGGNDILTRLFAERLTARLGKPVLVENRPGAGGMVGVTSVAKAPADGYTLVLLGNSDVVNQFLHDNVAYNVQRDFAPISLLITAPLVLFSHPSLPPKTLSELVSYAKSNKGKLNYGSPGIGTVHHISVEMLNRAAGIDLQHVPYRGTLPSLNDLLANQIPLIIATTISVLPALQSNKIHPIATAGNVRSPVLPNVPTYAEAGVPGIDISSSSGFAAPAGTPPAIVERLGKEVGEIAAEPAFRQKLLDLGYTVVASTPQGYVDQIARDVKDFGALIPQMKAPAK